MRYPQAAVAPTVLCRYDSHHLDLEPIPMPVAVAVAVAPTPDAVVDGELAHVAQQSLDVLLRRIPRATLTTQPVREAVAALSAVVLILALSHRSHPMTPTAARPRQRPPVH